jgi:formylglycine-generating enzyme required for sulfatase activity
MIIQKADSDCSGTLPPPGTHAPVWGELVKQWNAIPVPQYPSVELGPELILVGRDDCELDDYTADEALEVKSHDFGWDNENPCRQVKVGRFRVDFRPITVKEFYEFWVSGTDERVSNNLPANWVKDVDEGGIKV